MKIFNAVARSYKKTGEQKEQRHVVHAVFAKIRYEEDRVASCEFISYRS